MGAQNSIHGVEFEIGGKVSDRGEDQVRRAPVTGVVDENSTASSPSTARRFCIRGGGWSPDTDAPRNPARLEDEIRYTATWPEHSFASKAARNGRIFDLTDATACS